METVNGIARLCKNGKKRKNIRQSNVKICWVSSLTNKTLQLSKKLDRDWYQFDDRLTVICISLKATQIFSLTRVYVPT